MRMMTIKMTLAGFAAAVLGTCLVQSAQADTIYVKTFVPWTQSFYVESPVAERVVTAPVVIERPAATVEKTIIEQPWIIKVKEDHHLLNLKLF